MPARLAGHSMAKDDDILDEARELFRQCEEREADNRDEALDDLEFARLARQWRPEDEEQRANEGRPCLTINRMPAFIRQVVNDARQNTPAISVRAVVKVRQLLFGWLLGLRLIPSVLGGVAQLRALAPPLVRAATALRVKSLCWSLVCHEIRVGQLVLE